MRESVLLVLKMIVGLLLAAPAAAVASDRGSSARGVVELYTSQSCAPCPAADALWGELITRRPDIVTLEFHVDYWNDRVHGTAGAWRDPFSRESFSLRQRSLQQSAMSGQAGVYTPQIIIDGGYSLIGTDHEALKRHLKPARRMPLAVTLRREGDAVHLDIRGHQPGPADIWLVEFLDSAVTLVGAGVNQGRVIRNRHVVTEITRIGKWWQQLPTLKFDAPRHSTAGCAVLVQAPDGVMLGAAYCP